MNANSAINCNPNSQAYILGIAFQAVRKSDKTCVLEFNY